MKDLLPKIQSNDGQFHNGNPGTGEQGTRVTDTWLNNVQEHIRDFGEELKHLLKQAELEPNPAKKTQIYDAIAQIIENNRRTASTTGIGEVQLDSSTDSDAEDKAATPKAVNAVKALVTAVSRALNNYIPNSKKSSSVNSNSEDTVATSKAVKTVADELNSKMGKSGNQTLSNGDFEVRNGNHSSIKLHNSNGKHVRLEVQPDSSSDSFAHIILKDQRDSNLKRLKFPRKDGVLMVETDFSYQKIGDFEIWKFPSNLMIQKNSIKSSTIRWNAENSFSWAVSFSTIPIVVIQNKGSNYKAQMPFTIPILDGSTPSVCRWASGNDDDYRSSNMTFEFLAIGTWR